jgi:hypothetical protein
MAAEVAEPGGERNLCQLVSVFSTSTRQRIIRLLSSGSAYTFTDILNHLKSFDENVKSNNLSYHLKELGDLIEQNERAEYLITPKGQYVKEILDDLEATAELPKEGFAPSEDTMPLNRGVEKVVVGGMLVKVPPQDFVKMVKRKESLVVHSKIGTFRPKEIYFSCIDGMTIYCKSKFSLGELEHIAEASRIEVPKNMIVDI